MPNLLKTPHEKRVCVLFTTDEPRHTHTVEEVLDRLDSSLQGLTQAEAESRLESCGENLLPEKKKPALWLIFGRQFRNPLIYILIAAGAVSLLIHELTDASFILGVILLNAVLGTYQEYKAEQSAAALQQLLRITTTVRREGEEHAIDARKLVPGDIVLLESGQRVPADLRLIETANLAIDEAILTGESHAVHKDPTPIQETGLPLGDRLNLAYSGTTVNSGRGLGVVIGTGEQTEVGQIAKSVTEGATTKTPLVTRMESFSTRIAIIFMVASVLLGIITLYQGYTLSEVFLTAVALAVAAIPEGLPVAITVALSIGSRRMARRHVIVRKLMAVEGLGSCTYIASDKTGTLTVNQQTVKMISIGPGHRFEVSGEGYDDAGELTRTDGNAPEPTEEGMLKRFAHAAVLASDGHIYPNNGDWEAEGDPVDVAVLVMAGKLGLNPDAMRGEVENAGKIPYESERQFLARFYRQDGQVMVAVKGAGEKLLPRCKHHMTPEGSTPLDQEGLAQEIADLARQGYRVLLVAEGRLEAPPQTDNPDEDDLPDLVFLGLIGMIDPIRPEAKASIRSAQGAGVKVAMVTGDHPSTALVIARQLNIAEAEDEVVTGAELDRLGDPESPAFSERVGKASVFARVAPLQKLHIVEAIKKQGHFVAVTGDGVNDTPALRAANIGVAMGSGSDIAKDTAAIIITDDNFASIEAGVEEGRFAYDNVRKVIFLLLPAGIGEVILVILSVLMGLPLPLTAIQLLWLNLVSNGIQDVALAFEAGEPGALQRPPRDPREGVFDRQMLQQTAVTALTIGLIALGAWWWYQWESTFEARNRLLLLMVLLLNIQALNSRSETKSAFQVPPSNNWILMFGIIAAHALHILAMHVPLMQEVLEVGPLSMEAWLEALGLSLILLVVTEIFKWWKRRHPDAGMTAQAA